MGVMLVARNLDYLSQVQSTLNYSRKLAALGRLSAGVAHEVKNPLNAMMIHLELLKQKLTGARARRLALAGAGIDAPVADADVAATTLGSPIDVPSALEHVSIIDGEIRRLDQVVQGFLKFTRPEDLKLQPVRIPTLLETILPLVRPEADKTNVQIVLACAENTPDANGDPGLLQQVFLNLALNACQAMPKGGTLTMGCRPAAGRRVEAFFEDTGVGIDPDHLEKIFNLYFTTKDRGSGIGLSMVYRTIQLHDGDIEVQSTPGAGTIFRVLVPQA
jgi:signal transduction histidine kinase